MSAVYNPEAEIIARIERLELDAREIRRKLERLQNDEDRRVLNKLLTDITDEIAVLQARLP